MALLDRIELDALERPLGQSLHDLTVQGFERNGLLDELLALPVNLSVINVDDGSPDGTGEISDQWVARYPDRVRVVHRAGKLGLGTAYIAGFKTALVAGYDQIMTMDADFSHHPRYIPGMLDLSREYDLVIGSRYVRGGGTLNCSWKRNSLSRGANGFAKTMLGRKALDCTAGFRCYRRQVLEAIELDTRPPCPPRLQRITAQPCQRAPTHEAARWPGPQAARSSATGLR